MKKSLVLKGLLLNVFIGVHDHEKKSRQPFRLELRLTLDNRYRARKDDLSEVVDYELLNSRINQLMTSKHFNLQETAVQEVVDLCFDMSDQVTAVEISAAKMAAYPILAEVGLEYEMKRADWLRDRHTPLRTDI